MIRSRLLIALLAALSMSAPSFAATPLTLQELDRASLLNFVSRPDISCLHRAGKNTLGTLKVSSLTPLAGELLPFRPRVIVGKYQIRLARLLARKSIMRPHAFRRKKKKIKTAIRDFRSFVKQCRKFQPQQCLTMTGVGACTFLPPHSSGPGSIDPTFGKEGIAYVQSGLRSWFSSGPYALIGIDSESAAGQLTIFRYNQPAGTSSRIDLPIPVGETFAGYYNIPLRNGKILIGGELRYAPVPMQTPRGDIGLLMLQADGTPDTTFGTNGWVVIDQEAALSNRLLTNPNFNPRTFVSSDDLWDLQVYEFSNGDGRITVSGVVDSSEGPFPFFARFQLTGLPDASYGGGAPFFLDANFRGRGLQNSDGSNIVLGTLAGAPTPSGRPFVPLFKLTPSGAIDSAFGINGQVILELPTGTKSVDDIKFAASPSNEILVAASTVKLINLAEDIFIAKLSLSGTPITSFADQGSTLYDLGARERLDGLLSIDDGTIALGITRRGEDNAAVVLLVDHNGNTAADFGEGGIATVFRSSRFKDSAEMLGLIKMPENQIGVLGRADGKSGLVLVNLQ